MGELLDCLREKDDDAFHRWTKSEAWATVEQLLEANGIVSSLSSLSAVARIFFCDVLSLVMNVHSRVN